MVVEHSSWLSIWFDNCAYIKIPIDEFDIRTISFTYGAMKLLINTRRSEMKIEINPNGIWYHGSNKQFEVLREGSTITQWKELAKAFSHQPSGLGYDDDGTIQHNGTEKGYLYIIEEPVVVGEDVYQHPNTTMDLNVEFLTKRPLKVRLIEELEI